MPEGLEKDVSIDQMADLLTFLRSALPAPKPKAFAGNKPEVVRAAADSSLHPAGHVGRDLRPDAGVRAAVPELGW